MNEITHVTSVENKYSRAKMNNVLDSLNCLVSCTTNDVTEQDYGVLDYCGPVILGQTIYGNKRPRKSGTPVIVSNVFLGSIDANGSLTIENATSSATGYSINESYQYSLGMCYKNSGTSYCCRDNSRWCPATVCCYNCVDEYGNKYILEETTCIYKECIHQHCFYNNIMPGRNLYENGSCYLAQYGLPYQGECWTQPYHACWDFCDGAICYRYQTNADFYYTETSCCHAATESNYGPFLNGFVNGSLSFAMDPSDIKNIGNFDRTQSRMMSCTGLEIYAEAEYTCCLVICRHIRTISNVCIHTRYF